MPRREYIFWIVSGLTIAVAVGLFHRTVLVDHPEFVSGVKLLLGLGVWSILTIASWLSRPRVVLFWCVAAASLGLVTPTILVFLRAFFRSFST